MFKTYQLVVVATRMSVIVLLSRQKNTWRKLWSAPKQLEMSPAAAFRATSRFEIGANKHTM